MTESLLVMELALHHEQVQLLPFTQTLQIPDAIFAQDLYCLCEDLLRWLTFIKWSTNRR